MTKTELLNRCAGDEDARFLLSRVLDRLSDAETRSIPAHTSFLSPGEQAAVEDMLRARGGAPRYVLFGGFPGAERRICVFLPDWQEEADVLAAPEGPIAAVRARFPRDVSLTHRDFLGALMGLGITREKLGDLLVGEGVCDILVLREALPILMTQFDTAGRARLTLSEIPLLELRPAPQEVKTVRDTVQTLRLDAVLGSGFSLSRTRSAELIHAGRVEIDHRPCDKPDRLVSQGAVLTCRGLGKCVLKECDRLSKKGRVMIVMERYV